MADDHTNEETAADARENVNEPAAVDDSGAGAAAEGHETAPGEEESAETPEAVVDDEVAAAALERFDTVVFHRSHGQPVLYADRSQWLELARWLHDEAQFDVCVDVCGVDHLLNARRPIPGGVVPERFEVVANFVSRSRHRRLRVICEVPATDPTMPSIVDVYPGVDWAERETFDLFGVRFEGHPDLTRILLPEDWEGWPLRKDDHPARVPVQFKGPKTTPYQQARAVEVAEPTARPEGGDEAT